MDRNGRRKVSLFLKILKIDTLPGLDQKSSRMRKFFSTDIFVFS